MTNVIGATNLILIDNDSRRRASISHAFAGSDIHVEPFENIAELGSAWPRSGVILIHDHDMSVLHLIERMAHHGTWFPIVAFSENPMPGQIVEAILEGAIDYVAWPMSAEELNATIARAITRAEQLGHTKLRELLARARVERLTRREREVLSGVASGMSNRLIGEKLAISPRTVEIHRANMLNKLGATHTSEAIRIAFEAAIIH